MSSDNSRAIQPLTGVEPQQFLQIQLRLTVRVVCGDSNHILHQSPAIPVQTTAFPLPLEELSADPMSSQIYIQQLLSSFNITAPSSEDIASQLNSFILQNTVENRAVNFIVIAVVDNIHHSFTPPLPVMGPVLGWTNRSALAALTMILEEESPVIERFRMEKLEENEEEDLGDCSICLDEIKCEKCEVVKIPCGHVYHKLCISTWLNNSNSCPLCRTQLPLEEDYD